MRQLGRIPMMLLVLALALGACADAGDEHPRDGDHADGPGATTSTTEETPDVTKIDWLDPGSSVDLGGGYAMAHCEGDAPIHCLTKDGEPAGLVELASYPVTSLDAHVEDFLTSFRSDRAQGCGPEYVVTPEPTTFVDAPDGLLVRYGFRGAAGANTVATERTLQWAGLRGTNLVLVSISAYDATSCVESGSEGTVAELAGVEASLADLVEGNALPTEVGPPVGL